MMSILFFYSQYFDMLIRFGAKIQTDAWHTPANSYFANSELAHLLQHTSSSSNK